MTLDERSQQKKAIVLRWHVLNLWYCLAFDRIYDMVALRVYCAMASYFFYRSLDWKRLCKFICLFANSTRNTRKLCMNFEMVCISNKWTSSVTLTTQLSGLRAKVVVFNLFNVNRVICAWKFLFINFGSVFFKPL